MRGLLAASLAAVVPLTGCYSSTAIRRDQLPLLNGSYRRPTGSVDTSAGTVYTSEVTVAHVLRPDGRNVEIEGEFDAIVETPEETLTFEHPVTAERRGEVMIITGANRAATTIPLDKMRRTEVSQFDSTATAVMIGVFLGAGVLATYFIVDPGP
jgi:hypothetical protein